MTNQKHLLIAALLAAAGTLSMAQTAPPPMTAGPAAATAQPDAGMRQQRWAQRRAQHMDRLKAMLKLSPAQEGAWSNYAAAMQQPRAARTNRKDMQQLTTPQRIERIQAMQAEHQQRMNQRLGAISTFYAQLSPDQQKVFDQMSMRHGRHGRGGGHGMPPQ